MEDSPFVKEYDGIITTLKHLGYVEGQNLFIWPYDWRKSVPVIVSKLESYITSTVAPQNPGKKIQFIGHSLGGIVARAWSQSGTNDTKTDKIITAGSPHQGVSQFYKVWSGGELLYSDSLTWLAEKLILELNKNSYTTPRQTLQTILPVVKDLLPTSPYLRRQSTGSLIPIVEMSAWNTFLSNLNSSSSVILPLLTTLTAPETRRRMNILSPLHHGSIQLLEIGQTENPYQKQLPPETVSLLRLEQLLLVRLLRRLQKTIVKSSRQKNQ